MQDWTQEANIVDKGKTQLSDIDRLFINTNAADINNTDKDEQKIPNKLQRYEFLELMIRIANQKFRETKQVKTFAEALLKLIDHIFSYFEPAPWQGFRDQYLWEIQSNDILQAN